MINIAAAGGNSRKKDPKIAQAVNMSFKSPQSGIPNCSVNVQWKLA
jgi:hypothetical protein